MAGYPALIERTRAVWERVRTWGVRQLPSYEFWNGGATALAAGAWLTLALTVAGMAASAFSWVGLLGLLFGAALMVLTASVVIPVTWLIARLNRRFLWALAFLVIALNFAVLAGPPPARIIPVALLAIALILLGGGLATMRARGRTWKAVVPTLFGSTALLVFLAALVARSWPGEETIQWSPVNSDPLNLQSPSQRGDLDFDYRTYGSGTDPRRVEFGAEVDHVTESVDGSKLIDRWSGGAGWARTRYWGVEPESLPVQGRAWIPKGDGPFPIVLIVHGNHGMEDHSDVGYAWLGELFASRGFITASVDQNFLNAGWSDILGIPDPGLKDENDARGWMLLQHLAQWRAWNADPAHEFGGRVDLDNVVLIGHSRGGEAVSEAALFNRLHAYPDDATLGFDFGFGLRGIIAIAPVDAQYNPRERDTPVRDVSYLVLHGSHDGDVTSFVGSATYARVAFDTCAECFKAGFYLLGANHGQFNTAWGDSDMSLPMSAGLDRAHLMSGDDQRTVGGTLMSAFLEAAVRGRRDYRAFLAQPDRAHTLFPPGTRYLSQYRDARELVIADYEEDADAGTATLGGGRIEGDNLALWRESEIALKWNTTDTAAAVLGWAPDDAREHAPRYALTWPLIAATPGATLNLTLAPSTATPGELDDYETPDKTDFSLELIDAGGRTAALRLSQRRALVEQVEPVVFKLHDFMDNRSEAVFQRYRFRVGEWLAVNPELNTEALTGLRLVFDQTPASAIILDDVTLSQEGY